MMRNIKYYTTKIQKKDHNNNRKNSARTGKNCEKIHSDSRYRMTIETTEKFFNWCTGADGAKMILFIILMISKIVLIYSSAKYATI